MRVYFLRLTSADFTKVGNTWTSPAINLYDNSGYRNYSTTKSTYGLPTIETTWIGMSREVSLGNWRLFTWEELRTGTWVTGGNYNTDSGLVLGSRFVDTSGRIDIVSYEVRNAEAVPVLTVYTSDHDDATYLEQEWAATGPFGEADEINIIQSPKYAVFKMEFDTAPSNSAEFYVRVEIDQPVMAPMYRSTRRMLEQFPEWMAIRELDNYSATPSLATPQTIGGKVINAVSGRWMDDIRHELVTRDFDQYISTVSTDLMAWAWKSTIADDVIPYSIKGDGVELARSADLNEFYDAINDDACFMDGTVIYTTKKYTTLTINGVTYIQEPHRVWNHLDEFGMLVDLPRLHLEDNVSYRTRILDVYRNRGGVGRESMKLALRRELNLWKYMATPATPDSLYAGATPEILELTNIESDSKYFTPDGLPTDDFVRLAERLAHEYPTTWGRFLWGQMRWDLGGPNHEGYGVVPYQYDAATPSAEYRQAGVGDIDDLFVEHPDAPRGAQDVNVRLKVRGRYRTTATTYPLVAADVEIWGEGDKVVYSHPEETVWLTVEVTTNAVTPQTYYYSFQHKATSDVDANSATPTSGSYSYFDIFSELANATREGLVFKNKVGDLPYPADATPGFNEGQIPVDVIATVQLKHGQWTGATYANLETSNTFEAWWSSNPTGVVTWNNGATPSFSPDADGLEQPVVTMKSLTTASPTTVTWTSTPVPHRVEINGAIPLTSPASTAVSIPEIPWDSTVTNRYIKIRLTQEHNAVKGAFIDEEISGVSSGADKMFVPASSILVDGNGTWTDGVKTLADSTTSVTFSTTTATAPYAYPPATPKWSLFEYSIVTPIAGVVDENGPWKNGVQPQVGNQSDVLAVANLSRADFAMPQTADYVITWMGVEVDNDNVVAWLDCNSVKTAVADEFFPNYPDNAIVESLEGSDYVFSPVVIRARLREDPNPQWYPQVNAGYLFSGSDEYYLFARRKEETTSSNVTSAVLSDVARQGAPIIVFTTDATPIEMRQVAFFNDAATPVTLSLTNTEVVKGTGTTTLYAAYANLKNVTVTNVATGATVAANSTTSTNEITTTTTTDREQEYKLTYTLSYSFYADQEYIHTDNTLRTKLHFDAARTYKATYEIADYDTATPVDLPLSPMYTSQNEGFIFVSHNEYTLDSLRVVVSPSKILADGSDYLTVTLYSLDKYGNPKPGQAFSLATTFGTLSSASVTTDSDGLATVILTSASSTSTLSGTITITGATNATVAFDVEPKPVLDARLMIVPRAAQIEADGVGKNSVFGRLEKFDSTNGWVGLSGRSVAWRKGRSLYEIFSATPSTTAGATPYSAVPMKGSVTTDSNGNFIVGSFMVSAADQPGYWFFMAEAIEDSIAVGDVVCWYEYPVTLYGVEDYDGQPPQTVQMATPLSDLAEYQRANAYPTTYDEATPNAAATPDTFNWQPPKWYAINKYKLYQLGLMGNSPDTATYSNYTALPKHTKDI